MLVNASHLNRRANYQMGPLNAWPITLLNRWELSAGRPLVSVRGIVGVMMRASAPTSVRFHVLVTRRMVARSTSVPSLEKSNALKRPCHLLTVLMRCSPKGNPFVG